MRFKEFSGEWEKCKIKEILKIKSGKDQKEIKKSNGKYYIYGTGGIIGRTDTFLYDKESVGIGRKGTIDKPVYFNKPFWTVDTLFYSEINKNYYVKFVYYLFETINWKMYDESTGVPSLSSSTIESIGVHITNKEEQQKIVDFLTLIDKRIETQMKIIEEYKSLIKGIREKMFNNADELIEFNKIAIFENKTNHLSNAGLQFGEYLFFTNEENTYKYLNSFDFDGEFIIANTGGKANFKYYKGKFAVMTDCLVIQIKNKNETYYYFNVLKGLQDKIDNIGFEGSGLKHLNKNWLFNLKVPKCININYTKVISLMEKGIQINIKILNNLTYCKKFMLKNLFI